MTTIWDKLLQVNFEGVLEWQNKQQDYYRDLYQKLVLQSRQVQEQQILHVKHPR